MSKVKSEIVLRLTTEADLPFVVKTEQADSEYITSQTLEEHREYLADEDICHLIIENEKNPVGYLILAGLRDQNENIEFRRIVIAEKGCGFGRKSLRLVKKMAFEELNAHRLFLDVKDFNKRARHLYETEGFRVEGVWRECLKGETGRDSLVFMSILKHEYRREI